MEFIPLASPDIIKQDIQAVVEVLESGMLVQGQKVNQLELNIAKLIGADHVSATSNGTSTMHLALVALGIGAGDEVIVPAFSYVATANVVELVGATPVFVDIDMDSFNIDVSKIEEVITNKTKAIMPVHEFGLACDMEAILAIAEKNNLKVIEDAACALGAQLNGKFVGTFGDFGSFSLHPRKAITSGEGGLLVVKDSEYHEKINVLRNHGVKIIDNQMKFVEAGFNYRLTDIQAALVDSQLSRLTNIIAYKRGLAQVYLSHVTNEKIILPTISEGSTHTWQTFHLLLDSKERRNRAIETLRKKNIGTNYGAQCIPAQDYYLKKYKLNFKMLYPNALRAFECGLAVPLYEKLSKENILYIAEELNKL